MSMSPGGPPVSLPGWNLNVNTLKIKEHACLFGSPPPPYHMGGVSLGLWNDSHRPLRKFPQFFALISLFSLGLRTSKGVS